MAPAARPMGVTSGCLILLVALMPSGFSHPVPRSIYLEAPGPSPPVVPAVAPNYPASSSPAPTYPPVYPTIPLPPPSPTPPMPNTTNTTESSSPPSQSPSSPPPSQSSSSPPPYSQSPSSPPPYTTPSYQPTFTFTGAAHFIGPAVSCEGTALDAYGSYKMSTNSGGNFTAVSAPSAVQVFVEIDAALSSACVDSITTLPLPYSISGVVHPASSSNAAVIAVVTPVTKILQYVTTSDSNAVHAAYGFFGIDATQAPTGGLTAMQNRAPAVRLTGIRMLFADASLSSLVITTTAALAAFPSGTLTCASAAARVDAVYHAIATRISASSTSTVDLTSASLFQVILASAARDYCGAQSDTAAVTTLSTAGALAYQAAADKLNADADSTLNVELPLRALSIAARVSYVVQHAVPPAMMDLAANDKQAVATLVSGFNAALVAAPVSMAAMAAALGMETAPAPTTMRVNIRNTGGLANCMVVVDDLYTSSTSVAVTDITGTAILQGVVGPMVTVPAGCKDAVLSTSNVTVANTFPFRSVLPVNMDAAVLDSMSQLVTMVALTKAIAASNPPRHIGTADYLAVYNYFGVGIPGAYDALPANVDFVRQNWLSTAIVSSRAYLLNQLVLAVLSSSTGFVSGILADFTGNTPDDVSQAWIKTWAADLLAGTLKPTQDSYLNSQMIAYYQKATQAATSRRALMQGSALTAVAATSASAASMRRFLLADSSTPTVLTLEQLTSLVSTVTSTIGQITALFTKLDQQVAAAAAMGSPIDPAVIYRSAAQIASVQQTSLSATLSQLAAAVRSGDTAAISSLTAALASNFSGAALQAQVQAATIDDAALAALGPADPATENTASSNGSSSNKNGNRTAIVVGVVVGVIGGAVVVAAVALVTIKARRNRSAVAPRADQGSAVTEARGGPADEEAVVVSPVVPMTALAAVPVAPPTAPPSFVPDRSEATLHRQQEQQEAAALASAAAATPGRSGAPVYSPPE